MNILNFGSVATIVATFLILAGPLASFAASPSTVNLGTAANYVILTKTGVSTTGSTAIVGDIGVSPVAASYLTGFALILPTASPFSTSAKVTGKIYASDYANPTPANLTTAILDMQTAYTDAVGRAPDVTELGAGNIGGLTIAPGVYKWGTGVTIPVDVTLTGGANDVWIFQIAQGLNVSSSAKITLAGGAQARNIFWVVAGQTTIGTGAVFNGNILDQTAVVLNTGAVLNGRALAQTAVTLDANAVTIPSESNGSAAQTPAPTPTQTNNSASSPAASASVTATAAPGNSQSTPAATASSDPRVAALLTQITGLASTLQTLQMAKQQSNSASNFGSIRSVMANLQKGSRGDDVATLQEFLISQNMGSAAQALAGVGATSYFGSITRTALAEYQAKVGISPALGNFGPITRAHMSSGY